MKKKLWLFFLMTLFALGGCTTPQVVVKMNGMQMAPEAELQSHPASRLSCTYSYYRVFKQKIKSRGYEEEIRDTEPLKTGVVQLPKNTEAVGVLVYIHNPEMRRYKFVVTKIQNGEEKEIVLYEGIRPDNLIRHIYSERDLTGIELAAKIVLPGHEMRFKGITITVKKCD